MTVTDVASRYRFGSEEIASSRTGPVHEEGTCGSVSLGGGRADIAMTEMTAIITATRAGTGHPLPHTIGAFQRNDRKPGEEFVEDRVDHTMLRACLMGRARAVPLGREWPHRIPSHS